ncbi:MAG: GatB/YqeY domain-containing protein [Gammaproteobacteria bacterium]|nr:GatB/YqeY domain-containing protein [Gammaproteobacteria bacterium]MYF02087.1 GatB/YqeY domain-containing protein [Gammaproteobacteria bacterium]MYI77182.1 GatB/YqeY domain-containing protein [Gammaproteobacteria bacterium]
MDSELKLRISDDTRTTMRARDKARLAILRLINAEIKQAEIDSRKALTDLELHRVLVRMQKQRASSATQYRDGGRPDLATQEEYEIGVIQEFLPKQLTEAEVSEAVDQVCATLQADSMQHIGRVMGHLTQSLSGQADMALVSEIVKARLSTN